MVQVDIDVGDICAVNCDDEVLDLSTRTWQVCVCWFVSMLLFRDFVKVKLEKHRNMLNNEQETFTNGCRSNTTPPLVGQSYDQSQERSR